MKLTVLGTGNADVTECFHTCSAISDPDAGQHFLVDAGGGNYIIKALKMAGIPLEEVHDIFITHEHTDHLLGVVWLIRMIGQKMNQGSYEGEARIYCHSGLVPVIKTIAELTILAKVTRHIGERIRLIAVENGETVKIIGCPVTFFDICSGKAKQYGFTMQTKEGRRLSCCGDEPYNPCEYQYVRESDWLMHEAFCLYSEAEEFEPYEKHHSTVKEACETAEELGVKNLILYHTEEKNLSRRKERYTEEGKQYYHGNLYVPDDGEWFEI